MSVDKAYKEIIGTKKGEKVAIGVQSKGAEIQTFYIIDTKTGKILGDPIEGLRGFAWTDDEKHAYVWVQTKEMIDNQQPYKIYRHKLVYTFSVKGIRVPTATVILFTQWSSI